MALLYGTTNTMEHHHFNHAVMILSSESHNIFSGLSPENYSKVMKVLKHSILATDLSVYFESVVIIIMKALTGRGEGGNSFFFFFFFTIPGLDQNFLN